MWRQGLGIEMDKDIVTRPWVLVIANDRAGLAQQV